LCGYYPRQRKVRPHESQQDRVKVYMPTDEYRGRRSKRPPAFQQDLHFIIHYVLSSLYVEPPNSRLSTDVCVNKCGLLYLLVLDAQADPNDLTFAACQRACIIISHSFICPGVYRSRSHVPTSSHANLPSFRKVEPTATAPESSALPYSCSIAALVCPLWFQVHLRHRSIAQTSHTMFPWWPVSM
jgi:hypothetical protein